MFPGDRQKASFVHLLLAVPRFLVRNTILNCIISNSFVCSVKCFVFEVFSCFWLGLMLLLLHQFCFINIV